jgi:hypothetical protein
VTTTEMRVEPLDRRPPPIAAHRLLSDGRSSALVAADGRIDWWCRPRFHSPPVCWSLLDPDGGTAAWLDATHAGGTDFPAGPTTRTTLRVGFGAVVEILDALLAERDGTDLVRLARRLDAPLDVGHVLKLGGFDGPWAEWHGSEARFPGEPSLFVSGGVTTFAPDGTATTRLRAAPGEWAALVVGTRERTLEADGELAALADRVVALDERRIDRLGRPRLPRRHSERVQHTLAVLEACTDRETGGVIAAPTTSLPEVVGGDRQFDYRYTWLRDSSVAITAASLVGERDIAARYVAFLERLGGEGILETPVRTVDGVPVDGEREVSNVTGWHDSRPVRIGNAAGTQTQYDALGFVLDALFVYRRPGRRLSPALRDVVRRLADRAAEADGEESNGVWEIRDPAPLLSADIGRWTTLDRALRLTRSRVLTRRRRAWARARKAARARVLAAIRPDGTLPHAYDGNSVDASALLLVVFGLLPARDPRARRLVDATSRALGTGPLLHRYPPDGRDGFSPGESPFVPASWWAVSALAILGDPHAHDRADQLCSVLPALQPEELDLGRREALGNTPLLWSHAECTRALFELDRRDAPRRRLARGLRPALRRAARG